MPHIVASWNSLRPTSRWALSNLDEAKEHAMNITGKLTDDDHDRAAAHKHLANLDEKGGIIRLAHNIEVQIEKIPWEAVFAISVMNFAPFTPPATRRAQALVNWNESHGIRLPDDDNLTEAVDTVRALRAYIAAPQEPGAMHHVEALALADAVIRKYDDGK